MSPTEPVLQVRGLNTSFGANTVLRGRDLHVPPGQGVARSGPRGRQCWSGTPKVTLSAKSLMVSSPSWVNPRPCHPVAEPDLIPKSAPRPL